MSDSPQQHAERAQCRRAGLNRHGAPVVDARRLEPSERFGGTAGVVEHARIGRVGGRQRRQDLDCPFHVARLDVQTAEQAEGGVRCVVLGAERLRQGDGAGQVSGAGELQSLGHGWGEFRDGGGLLSRAWRRCPHRGV